MSVPPDQRPNTPSDLSARFPEATLREEMEKEQGLYQESMEDREWEKVTPDTLPLLFQTHARALNFSRLDLITKEMTMIGAQLVPMTATNQESVATLRGRMQELSEAGAQTIAQLWPNTKKVYVDEHPPVTPEDLDMIDAFVKKGAVDQLNKSTIPGWESLSADQRLLYRIDALQVYFARWHDAGDAEEFKIDESFGFEQLEQVNPAHSEVKRISDAVKEKIINRELQKWVDEAEQSGMDSEHPVLIKAKELLAETAK